MCEARPVWAWHVQEEENAATWNNLILWWLCDLWQNIIERAHILRPIKEGAKEVFSQLVDWGLLIMSLSFLQLGHAPAPYLFLQIFPCFDTLIFRIFCVPPQLIALPKPISHIQAPSSTYTLVETHAVSMNWTHHIPTSSSSIELDPVQNLDLTSPLNLDSHSLVPNWGQSLIFIASRLH